MTSPTRTRHLPTDAECKDIYDYFSECFGEYFGIETALVAASSDGSLGLNPIWDNDAMVIQACKDLRDDSGHSLISHSSDTPGHYHVNPYGLAYLRWYGRLTGKSEVW